MVIIIHNDSATSGALGEDLNPWEGEKGSGGAKL